MDSFNFFPQNCNQVILNLQKDDQHITVEPFYRNKIFRSPQLVLPGYLTCVVPSFPCSARIFSPCYLVNSYRGVAKRSCSRRDLLPSLFWVFFPQKHFDQVCTDGASGGAGAGVHAQPLAVDCSLLLPSRPISVESLLGRWPSHRSHASHSKTLLSQFEALERIQSERSLSSAHTHTHTPLECVGDCGRSGPKWLSHSETKLVPVYWEYWTFL